MFAVSVILTLAAAIATSPTVIDTREYRLRRETYNAHCSLVRTKTFREPLPAERGNVSAVRLAATHDRSSIRISWSSPRRCVKAYVVLNDRDEVDAMMLDAQIEQPYNLRGGILSYESGYFYHVLASALEGGKRYFYRVHCDSSQSITYFFDTPPSDDERAPVRVAILADHGTRAEGRTTIAAIAREIDRRRYDLVLHAGDLSYANGGASEYLWDAWGAIIEPVSARLPYMVAPGNHEIMRSDSGGENGVPYGKRFAMPLSSSPWWYSWDWGLVHFISLSSEHPDCCEQRDWLERDLQGVNRSVHPWIVTFAHEPIHTSNGRHGNNTRLRSWLDPLLADYDVDLSFWGHDHAYERSYPIRNGVVVQRHYENPVNATVHVTCGSSGWDLHDCWNDANFSAFHNGVVWGFCTLDVDNPYQAEVRFINSKTETIVDKFVLQKERSENESVRSAQSPPESSRSHGTATIIIILVAVGVVSSIVILIHYRHSKRAGSKSDGGGWIPLYSRSVATSIDNSESDSQEMQT